MKKLSIIAAVSLLLLGQSCKQNTNAENSETTSVSENNGIFPKGDRASSEGFTGEVYSYRLVSKDKNNDFAAGNSVFEPGARTKWHRHPKGQVLLITDGVGLYQEKGKPAQLIKKGDVINIAENVEHWHGATESQTMTHIAITNYVGQELVSWLQPVTDEEFAEANKTTHQDK